MIYLLLYEDAGDWLNLREENYIQWYPADYKTIIAKKYVKADNKTKREQSTNPNPKKCSKKEEYVLVWKSKSKLIFN